MKKLIVLAAALCMVATSAFAAEWNFYGSSRVSTEYLKVENQTGTVENTNLGEWLQTNARIGANVKASDSVAGRFEYGASGGNANIRLLYGTWNFGGGSLLIGQDYTPMFNIVSNSVYSESSSLDELDLLFYGNTYGGRQPQLKLMFGGFQIAAIAPRLTLDSASTLGASSTKVMLPKLEASYRLAQDNWWVKLAGGYQTFDIYSAANQTGSDTSVTAYIGTVGAGITFGPATFSGTVFGGQNAGTFAYMAVNNANFTTGGLAQYVTATNTLIDNDCFGYNLVAAYKANDMFTFEAGIGGARTKLDVSGASKDDVIAYYLQSVITLAKGVTVTPEIGKVDYKQSGQNENTYLAAKWQLDF